MAAITRDFPGMHPSVAPSWIPPSMAQESCAEEVRNSGLGHLCEHVDFAR